MARTDQRARAVAKDLNRHSIDMKMLGISADYKVVSVAQRSDGYTFFLCEGKPDTFCIYAGCKKGWGLALYKRHAHSYGGRLGRRKQKETRMILDLFEQQIKRPLK